MSGKHALVVIGGPPPAIVTTIPEADLVIAADRGADHAMGLDLTVDLLVGDMDSVSSAALADCREVIRHPTDKDCTDLELALAAASDAGASSVTIVGSAAGRVDHALGNLLVVASERWAEMRVDLVLDGTRVYVVRDALTVDGKTGQPVTLLAVGGPARTVTTTGLRWPLAKATLEAGSGLGLSNEITHSEATVEVGSGVVLVVLPGLEHP
ncbi:MAG: thiamine diphosphokinase [Actinomycetota bacterium]|nr:thiamine diphosphokinase [Actinomycetota bacterium]